MQVNYLMQQHPFFSAPAVYLLQSHMHSDFECPLPVQSAKQDISLINIEKIPIEELNGVLLPNPAGDLVTLKFNNPLSENSILSIYNSMGMLELKIVIAQNTQVYEISTSRLNTGVYLLNLSNNKANVRFQRLIIIR